MRRPDSMNAREWLFGTTVDRERLLDMEARLRPVRHRTFAILGLGLIACAHWAGWWTLAPMAVAIGVYWIAEQLVERVKHPEVLFFCTWVLVEAVIAVSVALSGSLREVAVSLLAIPVMTLNARFSGRGIALGVVVVILSMAGVLLATDPSAVYREPPILVLPVLLVIAWALLSTPIMRSDIEHRGECVIDELTGLLNRKALLHRADELMQQAQVTGEPVAIVMGDIDHFKEINDVGGHGAGDRALADVGRRLRKQLRAFDLVYRYGGEEFVVLLPGANLDEARGIADTLRSAIRSNRVGEGWTVTMSFGVSASTAGQPFDFDQVLAEADAEMYRAKREGRDRVCTISRTERYPAMSRRAHLGLAAGA